MPMRRGDVVAVAAAGDYGKPRPAVIVQSDAFPESHASVIICQMTSEIAVAMDFRVTVDPSDENGLRAPAVIPEPVLCQPHRVEPEPFDEAGILDRLPPPAPRQQY